MLFVLNFQLQFFYRRVWKILERFTYFTALPSCIRLVSATNILTLNKLQFFGMMTSEYLDQIQPVAARERLCDMLSLSAGRCKSPIPAITNP